MTKQDIVVVGGGFYGCCIALFLRSKFSRIAIVEEQSDILTRASLVNQARVHSGFHYPRSFVTAKRSLALSRRFMSDFPEAIVDNFQMLYAIARHGSRISAARFAEMYQAMGASIATAAAAHRNSFDPAMVEEVFACEEYAFDALKLRSIILERLDAAGITLLLEKSAMRVRCLPDSADVDLSDGSTLSASHVFNATYSRINQFHIDGKQRPLPIKSELAEIALLHPPESLRGIGVTVMDGPFFSLMPYPPRSAYSLTHVRYTPHVAWTDEQLNPVTGQHSPKSRWVHMARDVRRFMPCLEELRFHESLYETKAVLQKSEGDDGRPILVHRHQSPSRVISVLGGKIDNIYDLFDALGGFESDWLGLSTDWLTGRKREARAAGARYSRPHKP